MPITAPAATRRMGQTPASARSPKGSTERTIQAVNAQLNALSTAATSRDKVGAAIVGQMEEILYHDSYTAAFLKIYPQVPESVKKRHRPVCGNSSKSGEKQSRTDRQPGKSAPTSTLRSCGSASSAAFNGQSNGSSQKNPTQEPLEKPWRTYIFRTLKTIIQRSSGFGQAEDALSNDVAHDFIAAAGNGPAIAF